MAEYIYYRPEWTCGRYNKEANVAIYYNLIEGMSYFFEDDSAEIVGWLLNISRNSCFSVNILSEETDTAIECLIPFLAELVSCGLLTTAEITQEGIKNYRQTLSHDKCSKSQTEVKTTKEKLPIAVSSAEREYMNRIAGVASVMFELTYNCSEKCIHCYNIGATRNDTEVSKRNSREELTLDDYYRIIDELNEQGLVKICLSGGDPFSKPFVWEIIDYLYKKEIAFDIFTNGQKLSGQEERLANYYPRLVAVSIYSGDAAEHDYITRIGGSWAKSMNVVKELSKLAVPLNLKCCIMRPNVKHYYQVADLAKKYGAVAQFEVSLVDSVDGDKCVSHYLRLTPELLEIVLRDDNVPLYVGAEAPNFGGQPKLMSDNACGAGYNTFCITPEGNLIPCCSFHTVFGNLKHDTFKHICQNSEDLHLWQSLTLSEYQDCGKHEYCDYCNLCVGNNYSEHGNPTIAAENNCYIAKVRYELATKMKNGYDPLHGKSIFEVLNGLQDYTKEKLKREYSQDYSDKRLMVGG
ncbi:radical SAM protein [Mediterranea massiliensis]|uniref:radical SAM protein n=1 Tax=Mediterranea massiliensis TaxID=1841865 RepID=UPI00266CD80C|nr:radical SAM protein [Mediterranea massiliensis]